MSGALVAATSCQDVNKVPKPAEASTWEGRNGLSEYYPRLQVMCCAAQQVMQQPASGGLNLQ